MLVYLAGKHSEFIERLFESVNNSPINAYKINICLCGIWTEYIIDDYLPFVENTETGELSFLFSSIHGEGDNLCYWLPLLEKAYAKAYGGYCNIGKQSVLDCIEEITGAATFTVELQPLKELNSDLK